MKPIPTVFAATLLAAAGLTACAGGYGGGGGAPGGYYDAAGYNAYYDDGYGPFYDGYWDGDTFLFARARGGPFERDEAHHFQRSAANGFHGVHGNFHAPSATAHAAPAERRPG
jgi:hypothetical protein